MAVSVAGAVWVDDDSSIPAWLEAVATLTALIAAVIGARYAAGAFRLETIREERWYNLQRQSQADLVGAWFVPNVGARGVLSSSPAIALVNASPLPVYDVQVIIVGLEPTAENLEHRLPEYVEGIPATLGPTGPDPTHVLLEGDQRRRARDAARVIPPPAVVFEFTDAQGQRWMRRADGKLLSTGSYDDPRWSNLG